jgi:hypothetical protein
MNRTLGTVACAALLALSLAGCGSSSDDKDNGNDSKTLSASDFKEQANQLCADANKASESIGADITETSSDAEVTDAIDQTVALNEKLINSIEDLNAPDNLADDVKSMLDAVRGGTEEMDKISSVSDLSAFDPTTGAFADADEKATALGLTECAK